MAKEKKVSASNGNSKPFDRDQISVPTHLHVDMERTITALDLHVVKQGDRINDTNKRIDRLVDAISRAKKVKGI